MELLGERIFARLQQPDAGLRLILEQPSRGRIFVLRSANKIIGMKTCCLQSALLKGVRDSPRRSSSSQAFPQSGMGSELLKYAMEYAKQNLSYHV
jgi:hypothetical protein